MLFYKAMGAIACESHSRGKTAFCVCAVLARALSDPAGCLALDPSRAITQYVHRAWEIEQGLPQNSVEAIAQSRDGYLWLGTQEGLVRFDGVRFAEIGSDNTPGMIDEFVTALLEDRQGNMWIGTWGGGLARLSGGKVNRLTTADGLASDTILCLYEDATGALWIGTDSGLSRLTGRTIVSYRPKDGLPTGAVRSLCGRRQGGLWIGTYGGLGSFDAGAFTTYGRQEGLPGERIRAVCEDQNGNLWIGMDGAGLCRLDGSGFSRVREGGKPWKGTVTWIKEDRDKNLWIGTYGTGLRRLGTPTGFETDDRFTNTIVV